MDCGDEDREPILDIERKVLGDGSFGVVFLGYLDGKPVAVKRIHYYPSLTDPCKEKTREETAMINTKHENVIKLLYMTRDEHFKYYVLEKAEAALDQLFLEDGDPKKFSGLMPPDEQVLLEIAQGLKYIQERGIIHRDIHPGNILVFRGVAGSHCHVKLADFGLSRPVRSGGATTYRAPEYTKGGRIITVKIDIFSTGCTFFYYVTKGVHPFGAENSEILSNIVKGDGVNFDKHKGQLNDWLVHLLRKMLEPRPDQRCSAEKVVEILKEENAPLKCEERQLLGEGEYSHVFLGKFNGIPVAVKRTLLGTPDKHHQDRESDVLLALNHPNVVQLLHAEDRGKFRLLVFELCSASLDRLFLPDGDPEKFRGSMPSEREVLLQIAKGLHHVHSKGLVHRNVKPSNILIAENAPRCSTVKLGGLGLTNRRCSQLRMKVTFSWAAPETTESLKSDIFSAGCVLFFYVTQGKHPFGRGYTRACNIQDGIAINLDHIGKDHFAYPIISGMIRHEPTERLDLEDVILMLEQGPRE